MSGRKMTQSMFSLYSQHRRITGMSMPSSASLWELVKREQIQKHNAAEIKDIWQEVRENLPRQEKLKLRSCHNSACGQVIFTYTDLSHRTTFVP